VCRFLLVSLNIDAILGEMTIGQRRKKLEGMARGDGLSDAYMATLTRLKEQKGNKSVLGLKVLMWVLYSKRPLRADELCHALGVEIGSFGLDPKNVPVLRTLQSSCLGLVTVEASSSTVRLVHFTLQEHLLSNPTLFHSPHATIAEVCLTYLNFGCIRDLSPTLLSAPAALPLLGYASCYWGEHTSMGVTENVKILALRLLDRFDEHISAQLLLLNYRETGALWPYLNTERGPKGFTGLHAVSFFGVVEIVAGVLEMKKWDVNASDCMGSTALAWAAIRGYEEVVEMLLKREDVNPDQANTRDGRTPLLLAAEYGHEKVARMLLEREDINPNQAASQHGLTPLSWVARRRHEGIAKLLLAREDINPNQVYTRYCRTPLSWASEYRCEGIVKMLLEREDINPNQADTYHGRTPLSWAAKYGYIGVVKMLLEQQDVNPNQADTQYGQSPLSWAAGMGHKGVVKMLLKRGDVNPDQADTQYGMTPLSRAAKNGHGEVVKILLGREDVNPNQADTRYGQTPLSWAAEKGHEGVVKVLLEREDVSPDRADTCYGRTPLSWAAGCGYVGIVEMLLGHQNVNPDHADTYCSRTPLSRAAANGHEEVTSFTY